jgi:site-specific DNA-adenine methylase
MIYAVVFFAGALIGGGAVFIAVRAALDGERPIKADKKPVYIDPYKDPGFPERS